MRRNASTHKLLPEADDNVFKEEDEEELSECPETPTSDLSFPNVELPLRSDVTRLPGVCAPDNSPEPVHQRGRALECDRNQSTIKSALYELKNPLNVLVLGPHDSGKTTVINSLLMAVRKQWCDRARYGHGGKHQFAPVTLYENPTHHKRQNGQAFHHHEHYDPKWKRSPHDPCGRVTFWDTRGFDRIFDQDKASLLLRYILEGRLSHHNFNQALIQSTESLKQMYPEGNADLHIDLVLYVASAKEAPNHRYFEVINKAKAESKTPTVQTVPILTVLTKYDLLTADEISYVDENMTRYHPNSMRTLGKDLTEEEVTPYHVMAYNIHIDPNDNTAIPPRQCPKRDANMLKLFLEILALALPRGRRRCSSEIQVIFNRVRARLRRTRQRSSSSSTRYGTTRSSTSMSGMSV